MNKTDAIALILRQLKGALSPDEEQVLNAWLAQDPEHPRIRERIAILHGADWQSLPLSPPPIFFAQQREALLKRAAESEVLDRSKQTSIRIAAVVTLAVLATLFIYFTTQHVLRTQDTLSFSDTELHQVAHILKDKYHIPVEIDDSATGTLRFTGQFVNPDVTDVLNALRTSLPITIEQHDPVYVLKARN